MTNQQHIENYISSLEDWRGQRLTELHSLIHTTAPNLTGEWKWDVPVFRGHKLVLALSAFSEHVKINFFHGATVADPDNLFNSGLDSKSHRSINFGPDDIVPTDKLTNLIQAAVALDAS